jgi:N-acetylneuraminate synthase
MYTVELHTGTRIGATAPAYIIAEIGINHNGSLDIAKHLIREAADAGCNAVKFQKRTPELCVPREQRNQKRDTPWGRITYMDYRYKVEFGEAEYAEIDRYCRELGIEWFASCWDEAAVAFIEKFNPPVYKAASASLTDLPLLQAMKDTGKPLMLSTGMSTMHEIFDAAEALGLDDILIAHSTSAYPCPLHELNLKMIYTLKEWFPNTPIGYSGHETGLATTVSAVAMGACFVERHFTLDRAMWGSDQAASVEPTGMKRLVKDIRAIEEAMGDGIKQVYESELGARAKLRRVKAEVAVAM